MDSKIVDFPGGGCTAGPQADCRHVRLEGRDSEVPALAIQGPWSVYQDLVQVRISSSSSAILLRAWNESFVSALRVKRIS